MATEDLKDLILSNHQLAVEKHVQLLYNWIWCLTFSFFQASRFRPTLSATLSSSNVSWDTHTSKSNHSCALVSAFPSLPCPMNAVYFAKSISCISCCSLLIVTYCFHSCSQTPDCFLIKFKALPCN